METEIHSLDVVRSSIGETEYWSRFKDIQDKYSRKVAEVDDAERQHRSLQQAKETGISHDRPEQRYVDVMGQLKAQKITELISKLAECSSTARIDNLSTQDPFYFDKMDPIGTFERWWNEELESFPSYDYMQNFLRNVDINEHGFLIFKSTDDVKFSRKSSDIPDSSDSLSSRDSITSMNLREYEGIIKQAALKTTRQRSAEKRASQQKKARINSPLLANTDHHKEVMKRTKQARKFEFFANRLADIVYSYDLNPEVEVLLTDHIEQVCVPMGMLKEDEYRPMLEQFLRYVTDDKKRIEIIEQAILQHWRILSDGTV